MHFQLQMNDIHSQTQSLYFTSQSLNSLLLLPQDWLYTDQLHFTIKITLMILTQIYLKKNWNRPSFILLWKLCDSEYAVLVFVYMHNRLTSLHTNLSRSDIALTTFYALLYSSFHPQQMYKCVQSLLYIAVSMVLHSFPLEIEIRTW